MWREISIAGVFFSLIVTPTLAEEMDEYPNLRYFRDYRGMRVLGQADDNGQFVQYLKMNNETGEIYGDSGPVPPWVSAGFLKFLSKNLLKYDYNARNQYEKFLEKARQARPVDFTLGIGYPNPLTIDLADTTPEELKQKANQGKIVFQQYAMSDGGVKLDTKDSFNAKQLARDVRDGVLTMGLLNGPEWAKVHKEFPELKPVSVAMNSTVGVKFRILVKADSPMKSVADLKGSRLTLPPSPPTAFMYLEQALKKKDASKIFSSFTDRAKHAADAIDDVVDRIDDVTLVNDTAWEWYKSQKPGRAAKMKVIELEEPVEFPPPIFFVGPAALKDKSLQAFLATMNGETTIPREETLTLLHLSDFRAPGPITESLVNRYNEKYSDSDLVKFMQPFRSQAFARHRDKQNESHAE